MWDLLFKFIDGDTNMVDTHERMLVKCNIHDIKRKSITDTRPSPETLDVLNQLVEERALFTESILERLEQIDMMISDVLNKTE